MFPAFWSLFKFFFFRKLGTHLTPKQLNMMFSVNLLKVQQLSNNFSKKARPFLRKSEDKLNRRFFRRLFREKITTFWTVFWDKGDYTDVWMMKSEIKTSEKLV